MKIYSKEDTYKASSFLTYILNRCLITSAIPFFLSYKRKTAGNSEKSVFLAPVNTGDESWTYIQKCIKPVFTGLQPLLSGLLWVTLFDFLNKNPPNNLNNLIQRKEDIFYSPCLLSLYYRTKYSIILYLICTLWILSLLNCIYQKWLIQYHSN